VVEPDAAERDLAALKAVFSFWGLPASVAVAPAGEREPMLAGDMERFARAAGLNAFAFHGTLEDIVYELRAGRPVIVGVTNAGSSVEHHHFEVVVACDPESRRLKSLDPARGFVERTYSRFEDAWQAARQLTLVLFAPEGVAETASSSTPRSSPGASNSPFVAAPSARDASPPHRGFAFTL
jgi:hypothetical protein